MPLNVLVLFAAAYGSAGEPAAITIDATRRDSTPVPRAFFGQFGEHLGCNVYNGQWAQILRNPGFEGWEYFEGEAARAETWYGLPDVDAGRDKGLACYWQAEGDAAYALDEESFNSRYAQRIEARRGGGIKTPVMLPLHRIRDYVLSFHARTDRPTKADVLVQTADGRETGRAVVGIRKNRWTRHTARLRVKDGPGAGDLCYLVIRLRDPATVWLDHLELFPADHLHGLDPDVVRLCRELRMSLLRFPGGNFASGYHWRDGIGPRDQRVTMANPAWGGIEPNHFGTDEWMQFARAVGAEPLICVNCGNGTPEEAADWVRYCNDPPDTALGGLRARNGHRKPYGVRYWEIGNELWGDWQIGHCTPEEYAARYDVFSKAMLAADPHLLLIANGGDGDWNERFLRAVTAPVRSLSIHRLIGWGVPAETEPADVFGALAAYGRVFDEEIEKMSRTARACGAGAMRFAVTELMSVVPQARGPWSCSCMSEVGYFAGMMNACVRNRDVIELVTRTAVINHGGGRAKIREVAFPEPVHHLSRIYGTMTGRWPVACTVESPRYSATVRGLPAVEDAPALDCLALANDDNSELTLLAVNCRPGHAQAARIVLNGFAPVQSVRAQTLDAEPAAFNTWNEPRRVDLHEERVELSEEGVYVFPGGSFTALTYTKRP